MPRSCRAPCVMTRNLHLILKSIGSLTQRTDIDFCSRNIPLPEFQRTCWEKVKTGGNKTSWEAQQWFSLSRMEPDQSSDTGHGERGQPQKGHEGGLTGFWGPFESGA